MKHPSYNDIYRGGQGCTSDRTEKVNIKGVAPELVERAIAKVSAPRKNSAPMSSKPRLKHL